MFDIQKFLKDNMKYLQINNIDKLLSSVDILNRAKVIEFLYSAGIDIFKYLKVIPPYVLVGVESIKGVNIQAATEIKTEAFMRSTLVNAIIGSQVKIIGKSAFAECPNLKEVVISEGPKKIPTECFSQSSQLETVYIPDSVIYIYKDAFLGCDKVKIIAHRRTGANKLRINPEDVEFFKKHIQVEENDTPITEALNEKFSGGAPNWFISALKDDKHVKNIFKNMNVDLANCTFEDKDVATFSKRKDPILTDPQYIQVWLLQGMYGDRLVVMPYMEDYEWNLDRGNLYGKKYKYVPLKWFLEKAKHFCYIDTNQIDAQKDDLVFKKQTRRANQIGYDTPNERIPKELRDYAERHPYTHTTYDKSGYVIPTPTKIKDKLRYKFGDKIVSNQIQNIYDKLVTLKDDCEEILSRFDINELESDAESASNYKSVADTIRSKFLDALDYYRQGIRYSNKMPLINDQDEMRATSSSALAYLNRSGNLIKEANNEIKNFKMTEFDF